jgi:hypothetical protein
VFSGSGRPLAAIETVETAAVGKRPTKASAEARSSHEAGVPEQGVCHYGRHQALHNSVSYTLLAPAGRTPSGGGEVTQ